MKKSVIAIASAVALATSSLVAPAVTAQPGVSAEGVVTTPAINVAAGASVSADVLKIAKEINSLFNLVTSLDITVVDSAGLTADVNGNVVTVTAPADTAAGTYNLKFSVSAAGLPATEVIVPVTVGAAIELGVNAEGNYTYGETDLGVAAKDEAGADVTLVSTVVGVDGSTTFTFSNGAKVTVDSSGKVVTPAPGSENSDSSTPDLSGSENSDSSTPDLSGSENSDSSAPDLSGSENSDSSAPDLGGSAVVGGSTMFGSSDNAKCLPAILTIGAPLLLMIPLAGLANVNLPIVGQLTGNLRGEIERFNYQVQQQLGIDNPQLASLAQQMNMNTRQLMQIGGGVLGATAIALAGYFLYNACVPGTNGGSSDLTDGSSTNVEAGTDGSTADSTSAEAEAGSTGNDDSSSNVTGDQPA